MKISKIFAGMSALAIAATMGVSAAAKDYATDGAMPADWGTPVFKDFQKEDGSPLEYIPLEELEAYKDTGVDVVLKVSKLDPAKDYWLIAPANANGWDKLYATDNSYITGMKTKEEDEDEAELYVQQDDGFIVVREDATEIKFTLSADGVKYLFDNAGEAEDGTKWGGLLFQDYGVNVSSVTLGGEEAAPADPAPADPAPADPAPADPAPTTPATPAATPTGASAGLALAGLALAGAAVVVSKKK